MLENELDAILETIDETKAKAVRPDGTGLSQRQLSIHFDDIYQGYVTKARSIRSKLYKVSRNKAHQVHSDYRELKKEESYVNNALRLHELYFSNITRGTEEPAKIKEFIKHYGNMSVNEWRKEFKACALAARGWAIMGFDNEEKKIKHFIMDTHDSGTMIGVTPLLVCDVYEHSYIVDFGANKDKYVEWFISHIDWTEVIRRINSTPGMNIDIIND